MSIHNVGSLFFELLIFLTSLVNLSYAVSSLEPIVFTAPPESGIVAKCQLKDLYYGESLPTDGHLIF
ncbi:hypothetical protein Golomagni_01857 [Golovinomyces magnicellulatus]|nr:hypothetical protein Golomagni_01857 [Golovinomyces magnicellulatus]